MTDLLVSPNVSLIENRPATTSFAIAEHFGKRHADVLNSIRKVMAEMPEDLRERNFSLTFRTVAGPNNSQRQEEYFIIYQDGFMLLVMGYTGAKAMQIKIAYIVRFNEMADELAHRPAPALDSTLTPAQQSDLHNILAAKIGMLPKDQQGGAWPQSWERLKRHFKVAKYEQIPQSRYGEAVTYLIGMEIKPRALTRPEALPLPPARSAKALARDNWLKAHSDFYSYQNAVSQPRTWLEGETRALKRHCGYSTTENTALEVIEYLLALRVYLDGAITSAVSVARNLTA